MKINKIYPWIKLFFSALLFISYDYIHISHNLFIVLFIVIEIFMILSDILLYLKIKIKPTIADIGIYILYNYIALKIIL